MSKTDFGDNEGTFRALRLKNNT